MQTAVDMHPRRIANAPVSTSRPSAVPYIMDRLSDHRTRQRTRKRDKEQRDGRPPPFYRRRTFVASCENFVATATGVGWGPVWMISLHSPTPETPTLIQESGTYLLYKLSYSQFWVRLNTVSAAPAAGAVLRRAQLSSSRHCSGGRSSNETAPAVKML